MDIQLANYEIQIDDDKTVGDLIETAKEELSSTEERLVGIEVDGEFLTQTKLERNLESELRGKEIKLVTETVDELTLELVEDALTYLRSLSEWADNFSYTTESDFLSQINIEEVEQLLEGLHWLNLALEELVSATDNGTLLGGRSFPKFVSENRMFLNEIQGALENPEENGQLLTTLILQDLPAWIDEYREVFLEFRGEERRGFDD